MKVFRSNDIPLLASFIMKSGSKSSNKVIISSVSPKTSNFLINRLNSFKNCSCLEIGKDIRFRIESKYFKYNKLGLDRKINAFGALKILKPPFLIFDFGTATTIDYISPKGVFEGGLICPGIDTSLECMSRSTALLPRPGLKRIRCLAGRSTAEGMLAGVLQGYGAMVDGLTDRFRREFGVPHIKTVATGGLVDIISGYCRKFYHQDRLLTLRSMAWIYEEWLNAGNGK